MAEQSDLERPAVDGAAGEEFLRAAFQVLLEEAVRKGTDVAQKVGSVGEGVGDGGALRWGLRAGCCPQVCEWKEPHELRELLDLELRSHGEPAGRLLERCRDIIRYSVKTCERRCPPPDPEISDPKALATSPHAQRSQQLHSRPHHPHSSQQLYLSPCHPRGSQLPHSCL